MTGEVISIFSRRKTKTNKKPEDDNDIAIKDFDSIETINARNKKRIEDDRKNANKKVLRSYRIK